MNDDFFIKHVSKRRSQVLPSTFSKRQLYHQYLAASVDIQQTSTLPFIVIFVANIDITHLSQTQQVSMYQ